MQLLETALAYTLQGEHHRNMDNKRQMIDWLADNIQTRTDRKTRSHKQKQTERQSGRQTDTERQAGTNKERESGTGTETDKQEETETDKQRDDQTGSRKQEYIRADRQTLTWDEGSS